MSIIHCSGLFSSLVLLQRRWHELKQAARRAFVRYARAQPEEVPPPSPLLTSIVRR